MANLETSVDQDQQWLLNCLSATLDPNHAVRSVAEASLSQASQQSGFGSALAKVASNRELLMGLRQLAAILLKQFIKKHWKEGEESFELPIVSSDEKTYIRRLLLLSLDESHRKMCTAISMAVGSVAIYEWPDFLPYLLKLITDQTSMNGVYGALNCLALLSGDLDDKVVPTLIHVLFPCMLTIVSSTQVYAKSLRAKALSIVYSCTSRLGTMCSVHRDEARGLIIPMLKPWIDQFSVILNQPVQLEDPDDWNIRMEVFKCLNQFVQNCPSLAESEFTIIVGPLWQTFVTSLRVRSSVEGLKDLHEGRYDSDCSEKSFDSFVVQLFEFLLTIVGSAKFVQIVLNNIKELVYYTIGFLQITDQQVHTWLMDAGQFVADEDGGTYGPRVSGLLLLEEVANVAGIEGISAIVDAAKERFIESQTEKAAGSAVWWRLREATLFALASVSEQLLEAEGSGDIGVNLRNLLEHIITEDSGSGVHDRPFLYARIFTSVAKFSSLISTNILEYFLHTAVRVVSMDLPPPVKIGACRTLSQLLPEAQKGVIPSQMMSLLSSFIALLNQGVAGLGFMTPELLLGFFPEKHFNDKSVPTLDMRLKKFMPMEAEYGKLIDQTEKGVHDALRKYLKKLLFCLSDGADGPAVQILFDEVLVEVLARLPYYCHGGVKRVSRSWESIVRQPLFYNHRRRQGWEEPVICLRHRYKEDMVSRWYTYEPQEDHVWVTALPHLPLERLHRSGAAAVGSQLYTIGGSTSLLGTRNWTQDVRVLDIFRDMEWRVGIPLLEAIEQPLAVSVGNRIYVVGLSRSRLRAQVFNTGTQQWRRFPVPELVTLQIFEFKRREDVLLLWTAAGNFSFNIEAETWLGPANLMPLGAVGIANFRFSSSLGNVTVYNEANGVSEITDQFLVPLLEVPKMKLAGNRLFAMGMRETATHAQVCMFEVGTAPQERGRILRRDTILPRRLPANNLRVLYFYTEWGCFMTYG